MKFKLLKIRKRIPKKEDSTNDLIPLGIKETIGRKLSFNEMGERQLPSSKRYTNLSND